MSKMPDPNSNIFGGQISRPADGFGRWVYSSSSFEELFNASKDSSIAEPPFKEVIVGNAKSWKNTGDYDNVIAGRKGDGQKIYLYDSDGSSADSGYFKAKAGDGWQFLFYIGTDNDDWFDEEASDGIPGTWVESDNWTEELTEAMNAMKGVNWPTMWYESEDNVFAQTSKAVFALNGDTDDYVAIDVDSHSGDVGQFRIRMDNEQFVSNSEVDADVWITMLWARKWDSSYEWPAIAPPPPPPPPETVCEPGFYFNGVACVEEDRGGPPRCKAGFEWDAATGGCISTTPPPPPSKCDEGYIWNNELGICEKEQGGGGGGDDGNGDDEVELEPFSAVLLLVLLGGVLYLGLILSRGRS